VNNTSLQNQTKEDAQVPLHIQNEKTSSPSTSIQTPTEQTQRTTDGLSSTKAPSSIDTSKTVPTLDEKSNLKIVSDEIIPPVPIKINEQPPKDATQQNVIKEDTLLIHKETISSTQSHKQQEAPNVLKPIISRVELASDQPPPISNITANNKLQDNSSLNVKPSSPTPLQSDQPQQPISDSIQNVGSLGVKSDQQQKPSQPTQINRSPDLKLEQQQQQQQQPQPQQQQQQQQQQQPPQKPSEPTQINRSSDLKLEQQQQQQASATIQNTSSLENVNSTDQQQQIPNTIQNPSSTDKNASPLVENQQPKVVDTMKPTETVSIDRKSDDILAIPKESPTPVQTPPPPPRVLRSATSRMQAKAHAHHHHVHSQEHDHSKEHDHSNEHDHEKEHELEKIPITGKINFLSFNLSISFLRKCNY